VSAQVIARIDLTKIRDLNFGVAFRGTPKVVTFADVGAGTGIDNPSAALVKVTGEPLFEMKYSWENVPAFLAFEGMPSPGITEQLPVTLIYCLSETETSAACGPGSPLAVGNSESATQTFPSAIGPSETGEHYMYIAGTVTAGTSIKLGLYQGSLTVRASYVGL